MKTDITPAETNDIDNPTTETKQKELNSDDNVVLLENNINSINLSETSNDASTSLDNSTTIDAELLAPENFLPSLPKPLRVSLGEPHILFMLFDSAPQPPQPPKSLQLNATLSTPSPIQPSQLSPSLSSRSSSISSISSSSNSIKPSKPAPLPSQQLPLDQNAVS